MNAPASSSPAIERVFTAFFLFCGIGAGALGFLSAQIILNGILGRFQSLGGVDIDKIACRTFERLTKSPAYAEDIKTMTPARLREFFGMKAPKVLFLSAPCQGFSGLLSEEKGKSPKYQALNELAVIGLQLVLDAWGDEGPDLIIFENVPRITTRGKALLSRIRKLLRAHGYVTHEGTHNCGKIGALAQSRERFLLVARHARKVPVFLYQPEQHALRPCGEVLGTLPLPGDRASGRLHALPKISLRTWLRLAAIRPGKDWRDLSTLDGEVRPAWSRYAIDAWSSPVGAVAGSGTNSAWGVADVRVEGADWHNGALGVVPPVAPFGTITGNRNVTSGAFSLADVRVEGDGWFRGVLGVVPLSSPFGTITGRGDVSTGAYALADLAFSADRYGMNMRVGGWSAPAWTVTGATDIQAGAPSLADVRLGADNPNRHASKFYVTDSSSPARTITGTDGRVGSGAPCLADLRLRAPANFGCYGVVPFDQPGGTITGNTAPGGRAALARRPANHLHTVAQQRRARRPRVVAAELHGDGLARPVGGLRGARRRTLRRSLGARRRGLRRRCDGWRASASLVRACPWSRDGSLFGPWRVVVERPPRAVEPAPRGAVATDRPRRGAALPPRDRGPR